MPNDARTIVGVATSITAFLGRAAIGPDNDPVMINSFADFELRFGGLGADYPMSYAVRDFYLNGGSQAIIVRLSKPQNGSLDPAETTTEAANSQTLEPAYVIGDRDVRTGLYALEKADLFNLLCIPPDTRGGDTSPEVYQAALQYCVERRAMLLVDPPAGWGKVPEAAASNAAAGVSQLGLSDPAGRNAAIYFPRLVETDPNNEGTPDVFVPCGAIAGVMASTDDQRGVWKAPAGRDSAINGIVGLEVNLSKEESGMLNPLGINCLRFFPNHGHFVWGARTLRGANQLADEY